MLVDPMTAPASFPLGTSFPAISREKNKSVYRNLSGSKTIDITVSHQQTSKRTRSLFRVDVSDIATDPLIPANSRPRGVAAYLVLDYEPGFSAPADVLAAAQQLFGCMNLTSTFANLTTTNLSKFIGGES